mmetsp:Transcript_4818/g.8266  ORF Transcript_4818/g.8266 Transcript_4818/m.8266 type:complete len:126 (+) Transcript_4818:1-378(+)
MKFSCIAILALATVEAHRHHGGLRRLDTTLVKFVDDDASEADDQLIKRIGEMPQQNNLVQSRFVDEDDVKFNDLLAEDLEVHKMGDHGYLIDDVKKVNEVYPSKKVEGLTEMKSFFKQFDVDNDD